MKLAVVVVAYHAQPDAVLENIKTYGDYADPLILWDNTERCDNDWSSLRKVYPEVIVCQYGENIGLASAYNAAAKLASQRGCTHLMTMDQDSAFVNVDEYIKQIPPPNSVYGIIGVSVNRSDYQSLNQHITGHTCQSGSTFSLLMLDAIGGFRDDFFIGMVDAEICLRASGRGYLAMEAGRCTIRHHIGSGRSVSILGLSTHVSDYNALRHYYDTRNRIIMWHEFPDDCGWRFKTKFFANRLKVIAKILLFEDDKRSKVLAILRGLYHGAMNQPVPYKR